MTERADRLRGVLLMLAAVGAFALMDALMKHLAASLPAIQVASLRGMSSLPFVVLSYLLTGQLALLRPVRFGMHLLRGVLAIAMLWGFLWALARASMADTYAVFMCAPLLVVLTAALLLGEQIGRQVWIAIVVGLAGVIVILDPSLEGMASLAGLATLGSALAYAFVVVLVRVLSRTETTASMVFWFLLLLSIGAGLLAVPVWRPIAPLDWPWIAGIGLTGWAGQHLITEAFRLAPASLVSPFEYTALVWAMGIDWLAWQTLPGARMLAGSAIIVGAGLYLLLRERASARGP
ncbi:MAG: DMT family transporter [Steroidobacteraceae bacterium]